MAMKAVKLIKNNLLKAVQHGNDLEARSNMLIAANLAGIAFDHAMVGIVHAMSHATGGMCAVPHGLANSIYLPFGMEYNLESSATHYAGIARRFGIETKGMSPDNAARAAIDYVREIRQELKRACGLPDRLREAGVKEEQLEDIARLALEDGTTFYNPREVTLEGLREKIREAF
jgi:alcohol dehydrogenase class IV